MWGKKVTPSMGKGSLIAALDIGTTKNCCFIARHGGEEGPQIVGIGHQLSHGVRSGAIVDMDAAESSVRATVETAEQMAGENIDQVIVNLSGGSPQSRLIAYEVSIAGHEVGDADLQRVLDPEVLLSGQSKERELIHSIPVGYSIDAGVEVVVTVNEGRKDVGAPLLCESKGSLKKRIVRTMEAIIEPLTSDEKRQAIADRCEPTHGFWGTPPHPIEVLDLFPKTTHVFGWTRCVEQGRPADLDLEITVPDGLPIVFFSQGFCAKSMLAKHLAHKHQGMCVDVHDTLGAATMAKIEAFIRLSRAKT